MNDDDDRNISIRDYLDGLQKQEVFWSQEDEELIKQFYKLARKKKGGVEYLAKIIGRSYEAIHRKALRMGLNGK